MTLILKKITKIFEPNPNNFDASLWVQKVILKKYLNRKLITIKREPRLD